MDRVGDSWIDEGREFQRMREVWRSPGGKRGRRRQGSKTAGGLGRSEEFGLGDTLKCDLAWS